MVLYGIRDRWLPWTEKSYYRRPYADKEPARISDDHDLGPDLGSRVLHSDSIAFISKGCLVILSDFHCIISFPTFNVLETIDISGSCQGFRGFGL